jgi:fibronectin type 3 domain-containing protein
LDPTKTYYYKVSVVDGSYEHEKSAASNPVDFTPKGVSAALLLPPPEEAMVFWDGVLGISYKVYRRAPGDSNYPNYTAASVLNAAPYQYLDNSWVQGTSYRVSAVDGSSESNLSDACSAIFVGGVRAQSISSTSIQISWTAFPNAQSYNVYDSPDNVTYTLSAPGVTTPPYTATGLSAGTYYYKVSAMLDGGDETAQSAFVYAVLP